MRYPFRPGAAPHVRFSLSCAVLAMAALAGCTPAPPGGGVADPYEARNREVHAENVRVDRAVIRPVAEAYADVVPAPLRRGLSNAASNFGLPGTVLNDLLQFRPGDAVVNAARFAVNSTIGLGGLLDPAGQMGLAERPADFGQTLHVWGVREGAYLELPLLGPSTERNAVGRVVDAALNPTRLFLEDAGPVRAALGVARGLEYRNELAPMLDRVLDTSADSYAQARLGYIENRRFLIGQDDEPDYFDPYEELYGDGF